MRILIAEDDPLSSKILQFTLEKLGHEVVAASNGTGAWEAFDREPFRIVVSDWMMPGLDGLHLCTKVRTRPKTPYTYFILVTAAGTGAESYRTAMNAGIDDFLSKPLDRDMIAMRLRVAERILGYTSEIRMLKELIPICSYCKDVRNDEDIWQGVESYIVDRTSSRFSHGICPDCLEKEMAKLEAQFATSPQMALR